MPDPADSSPYLPPATDRAIQTATTQRHYGLPSLTLLVVASMIGAGVFTTSGFTLGAVGSPARVMLCWVIGGVIALCGAVAYGRLARLLPQSGGEYLFLSQHLHPFAGFLAGWVSLTAGFSGAIATAAVAFEKYAVPEGLKPEWLPNDAVAICLVLVCAAAHGLHAATGKYVQNFVVVVKLLALAVFFLVVALSLTTHDWQTSVASPTPAGGLELVTAIATSVVWISLSYAGFNAAIYVASESPDARRIVPKALIVGTASVTVFYLFLNAIFVTSAPPEELMWKEDVAAVAASAIGGRSLELVVRFAVALGLLSSVSGMIMTGPRVYSKMADDGVFPAMFSAQRSGISRSVFMQALIAIALILLQRVLIGAGVLTSSLLGLLVYLSTTLSLTSACCVATLFLPGVRREDSGKGVMSDLACAFFIAATLLAIVLLVLFHQDNGKSVGMWHIAGSVATFAAGTMAWFVPGLTGNARNGQKPNGV